MYCTGGIRCERGSAYLKTKVSYQPQRAAGLEAKEAPPPTQPAGLTVPLHGSSIEFLSIKSEVLKSQDVKSTHQS